MKKMSFWLRRIFFIVSFTIAASVIASGQYNNSISGLVFDASGRRPVDNVYVELMNEVHSTLKRVRTDASGRFNFDRLSSGNFKVKVLTTGTNFAEQTQDVSIVSVPRSGGYSADKVYLEIYLQLDKRKINVGSSGTAGVLFAQDVPEQARKLYKKGIDRLEKDEELGLEDIKKSIEIFPSYYDALDRLGIEYVKRKNYQDAVPFLIKAIDINPRSFSSYYALGRAGLGLNQVKEALDAFRAATTINPQSFDANLWYGVSLRLNGDYGQAEKILLQAKLLSKKSPVAELHWQLALLYNRLGRNKEAADELEEYLKIKPDSPDAPKIKELISKLRKNAK
jgi:tetratricopeptide (TPR) repeat protein